MKRLFMSLMLALCFVASASAQRYDGTAISYKGTPVPFAAVAVCTQPAVTLTTPCTPQATLYTDLTLSTPSVNPLTADAYGNYHFYVNPVDGPFTVQVYGGTITTPIVLTDQMPTGSLNGSASGITNTLPKWTGAKTLGNSCASDDGTTFSISCAQASANTLSLTNPLAILSGGNGTSTPALTAGLNVDLTGTWPNYTIGTLADVTFNSVTAQTVDATTINASNINSSSSGANGLISGGGIFWLHDLVYAVAKTSVSIGGQTYTAPQTDVILSAADPSNPRFDTFYADINSTINAITGPAGSNPVTPQVDPTTQWGLGYVEVTAGETAPSITNLTLYDENTGPPSEWTCSTSGSGWNCADTSHPDSGTKDISADGSSATSYVKLTADALTDLSSYDVMKVRLYTVSAWSGKNEVWLAFYSGTNPVGSAVFTSINNYGFDGSVTGSYQYVIIPMTAFNLGNNTVDSVRILWNTGGKNATGKTIYLDNIQLQGNGVTGGSGGSGNVTSVGMIGDNVLFTTGINGSPINSSGILDLSKSLHNFETGYFLRGPNGSLGSNVAVRQKVICATTSVSTTATYSCPAFSNAVAVGDKILIISANQSGAPAGTFTDSLGNTIPAASTTGSGSFQRYGFGAITTGGVDQITLTGVKYYTNTGGTYYYAAVALELTGTDSVTAAISAENAGGATSQTIAVSAGASTDAFVRFSIFTSGNTTTCTGTTTMSPVGTPLNSFVSADIGIGFGRTDLFAPGSTASTSNVAQFNVTSCGAGGGQIQEFTVVDLVQDSSAGSAPPVRGPITEGDLPASAISAIQSVNNYAVGSPVNMNSGGTTATVMTQSLTMPSQGCPCRVFIITTGIINSTSSGTWTSWVSDGTSDYATVQSITTDGHAPPLTGVGISDTYADNQAVTFTWKGNAGTFAVGQTMQFNSSAASSTSSQGSNMVLIVLQSRN